MMIKQYSLNMLQKALNKALSLDETIATKLLLLDNKVLKLIVMPLQVPLFITFQAGKIVLLENMIQAPDTTIESNPFGLIRLSMLPASRARTLFHENVKFSGDIELGQQIKKIFDELDIDWEGHLAHFTGDVFAYQIGSFLRRGLALDRKSVV